MMHTLLYSEMNQAVPGGVSVSPGHEGGYGECQVPSPSQWSDPCYSPPSFHSPQHLPGDLEKVKEEPFSPSPPSSCGTLPPSPPASHRASPYARPQPNPKKEGFEASLSLSELLAENQVLTNVHPQAAIYAPYPDHPLLRGRLEDNTFQKKMAALPYKAPSPSSMNEGLGFLDMLVDVKQEVEEEVSVGSSCGSPAVPANNHANSVAAAAAACQRDILETVEQLALEHARRDVQRVSDSLNIPRDPALWSVDDVRAWLNLQATQLHLPPLMLNFWNLGGPALLKLTESQFRQLAPVGGELLYAQLEIWRGALRAAPKLPQYQYRYRLYPDPIIIHQQQQCHQQVPQTTQLETSGQIGSPSQLGSPGQQMGSPGQQMGSPGQQMGSPGQQMGSPGQQMGSPGQQLGSPNQQLGSPNQQLGSPNQQLGSPGRQLGSPNQQLGSPNQQLGSGRQLGSPGQQLGSPGQQLGSHNQQLGSHNQQLASTNQQLGSPGQQLGSPSQQLGSPSQQLGSPSQQLGSPGQQLCSPNHQLGSPSSPPMSLTTNMGQVPTPVVQVTQQHLQGGGTGSCQPKTGTQTGTPSPQPPQQVQQPSGAVYLEEQCLEMTALLQQQASSPKAAHTARVPAHSPQDEAYDSDEEVEDEVCGGSSGSGGRGGTHIHLWQFLKELLQQPQLYGSCIRWLDRQKGVFKIEDSVRVARLWGKRKNRPAMNYDKLSRSIRQYYKKGIMKKTERSQRLVYQFCHPYCL